MFPRVNDSDLAILNTYFNYNNNDKSFTSKHNVNDVKYIWNNSFWTAVVGEIDEWSSQYIFQFKQLERRSLKKNQGFNGIRTRDLRVTGALLYQLSYEFHVYFTSFHSSREIWTQ